VPVDCSHFNPRTWTRAKFQLTLWCEHSRLPLPALNDRGRQRGVYEIELDREWFRQAAPFLKVLTGTLSLVLPIASSAEKIALDDAAYQAIEEQLDFGKSVIDATISEGTRVGEWTGAADTTTLERGGTIAPKVQLCANCTLFSKLRTLSFGGLVRVMNKRQEFLWVHERFKAKY
jgi:internalin A